MKKTLIAFALLLSCSSILNAQIETFDLSTFKLPYTKYESLILDFGGNNETQIEHWKDSSDYFFNQSNLYSQVRLNGTYNLQINTPNQQSSYSIGSYILSYPFDNDTRNYNDNSREIERNSQLSYGIAGSTNNRIYFNKALFIELRPSINLFHYNNKYKSIDEYPSGEKQYENIDRYKGLNLYSSFDIGSGYGRIEPVNDAQMALFILKDLKKENRLKKEPTHEEIYLLAELISKKKRLRFFDSRHKLISEVKAIDSLLLSLELVDQTDATYFTTIYDNWLYSNNPSRSAGFRVSFGPSVRYQLYNSSMSWETIYYQSNFTDEDEWSYKQSQLLYGAWADATYEKPINHKWQQTLSASARYLWSIAKFSEDDDPKTEKKQDNFAANLSAFWGYYPNTRSYLDFGVNGGWQKNNSDRNFLPADSNVDDKVEFERVFIGTSFNGYYYFSPQFRISLNGSLNYNIYNSDDFNLIYPPSSGFAFGYVKANTLSISFTVGLSYALF